MRASISYSDRPLIGPVQRRIRSTPLELWRAGEAQTYSHPIGVPSGFVHCVPVRLLGSSRLCNARHRGTVAMKQAIGTAPRDGEFVLLVEEASFEVAQWSADN